MTAEVAVINKSGVALASDSAVTTDLIDSRGRLNSKIYNTANKLFSLSKYAPVGIMVYNAMELCGVPWETFVKEYRKNLGKNKLDHLENYSDEFFKYLCGNNILFPEDRQSEILARIVARFFLSLEDKYRISSNSSARKAFDQEISELERKEFVEPFHEGFFNLPSVYISSIDKAAEFVFKAAHIKNLKARYRRLATLAILKHSDLVSHSGVVVAGFGEMDIYPRLIEYRVDLVLSGKVRKEVLQQFSPTQSDAGKVLSFAQKDITRTILEGINPSYANEIRKSVIEFVLGLPSQFMDPIEELDDNQKDHYKDKAYAASVEAIKQFFAGMDKERKEKHTFEIENAIQMMPFSELAEVAELFIRLTQARRRLSPDSETVGGPIDVAVISKSDGFIWIERKFYFDKELNYAFFKNYLQA